MYWSEGLWLEPWLLPSACQISVGTNSHRSMDVWMFDRWPALPPELLSYLMISSITTMAWVQNFSWVFVEYVKALVIFLCLIESVASGLHCLIYCLCMYISHLNQYEELEDGKYWTVIARELRQRFNVQKNYILLQNDSHYILLYYWTPCPTPTSKHQMDLSSCPPLHPTLCSPITGPKHLFLPG